MNVNGRLHNLSQEIHCEDGSKETWYAYSSHTIQLAANAPERRSASASQSVTPSPHKKRKVTKPKLVSWTIRLCQTINISSDSRDSSRNSKDLKEGDDSETESESEFESEEKRTSTPRLLTAWYAANFDESQSLELLKKSGEASWETLELRIRVAWDNDGLEVMVANEQKGKDGTFSSVKLALDSGEVEKEGGQEPSQKSRVEVVVHRLNGSEELAAASVVCSDLARAYNILKGQTESLKQERDGHRKLLQHNRRHERFKEANSSLINPGRLKRNKPDDEGFEGDDDDDAAQQLAQKGCEVVTADLSDASSVTKAIQRSFAVFSVTDFWSYMNKDTEVQQGKAVADASKAAGVKHLVWSGLPHVTNLTNVQLKHVSHFDGKAEVTEYIESIKGSDMAATYFMPAYYLSNLVGVIKPAGEGQFAMTLPFGDGDKTQVPVIDISEDTGTYVAAILAADSATVNGKSFQGVSSWTTPNEIVQTLSQVTGKQLKYNDIDAEKWSGFLPRKVSAELKENMLLVRDYSYYGKGAETKQAEQDKTLNIGSKASSLQQWAKGNCSKW